MENASIEFLANFLVEKVHGHQLGLGVSDLLVEVVLHDLFNHIR